MILIREGVTRQDDQLPPRMREAVPTGPASGHQISEAMLDEMLDEYYNLRGWDTRGIPTPETLERLGLLEMVTLA
jgi:aldehyde:ferredoxin oxidoreductase